MSATVDPGELFRHFLSEQTAAHVEGLGTVLPEGLVLPFEDSPLRPLDARAAWNDAQSVLTLLPSPLAGATAPPPPDWSGILLGLEPTADVPLGLGNFPQRVRSLALLIRRQPTPVTPTEASPDLLLWANGQRDAVARLLAAGVLRLVGDLDRAAGLLTARLPASLSVLQENERACLLWHQGRRADALARWESLPDCAASLCNRGMAQLFLGRRDAARTALATACAGLPESSSWHHLASVYRTLADLD